MELRGKGDDAEVVDDDAGSRRVDLGDLVVGVRPVNEL